MLKELVGGKKRMKIIIDEDEGEVIKNLKIYDQKGNRLKIVLGEA